MFLNPNQIEEILSIVKFHHIAFIAKNISSEILSSEDIKILEKYNFSVKKYLITNRLSYLDYAFRFGMISTSLKKMEIENWNYSKLKWYIKNKKYIPLTKLEKNILDNIKHQSFKDIKGLGNKVSTDLNKILIDVDNEKRLKYEKIIRKEAIKVVENRETVKDLVSRIGNKTQDWNRDLGRIADFIMHKAFDEGRAVSIEEQQGEEAEVYKDVYLGACEHCIRLYLTNGLGSQPKIFKLKELKNNRDNIGRKVKDWKPVIGATHPFCRCTLHLFPLRREWDPLTNGFTKFVEGVKPKIRKTKLKVSIGGEEKFI